MEKYVVPLYEEKMVDNIIDQIMSPNKELKTEVNICRSSKSSTLVKASTYLSKVIARIYPSNKPSPS